LSYLQPLSRHAAVEIAYRNEGHIESNHRDDLGGLLWIRTPVLGERFLVGVGMGPELYFDTRSAKSDDGYSDTHGYTLLGAAELQANMTKSMFLELRLNRTIASSSFRSQALLTGVGYRLPIADSRANEHRTPRAWVFISAGQRILNSFDSEEATAFALQYDAPIAGALRNIVSYLNEGSARGFERGGFAVQPALSRAFFADAVTLGIAAGPYLTRQLDGGHTAWRITALLSASAVLRITEHYGVYLSGNRVFTGNDRDADVLLVGGAVGFDV